VSITPDMSPLPPLALPGLVVSALAVMVIVLPVLGLLVVVMPHATAAVVALFRRDTPFVSHRTTVTTQALAVVCMIVSVLALVAVQPRYFRAGRSHVPAQADAGDAALRAAIAPHVEALVDSFPCSGVVVGVVGPSGNQVFGFGRRSAGSDVAPNGETVFEIGGLTQVFTASLFARMVEQRVVAMDQTLQSLMPDTVSVPMRDGHAIELQHLATWSSGLPRLARNHDPILGLLPPFSRARPAWSRKGLNDLLSRSEIAYAPGTHLDDSDLGMAVLGHALERASHADYETLLQREICRPLGLRDTRVAPTPSMQRRLATGMTLGWGSYGGWHVASPTHRWPEKAIPGATDLCSTTNDLLTLVRAHLAGFPLAGALGETRRTWLHAQGRPDIGLGWFIDWTSAGESIVWQHGEAGASRSYVAFIESRGIGVVVLANAPIDVDLLAKRILNRLLAPNA
jgi:CubicO group peptidase (beta-lactamase class C family)